MPKAYGKSSGKDSYAKRGSVGMKSGGGGKGGGDQFFKNCTMKNKEGVGSKLNIDRRQPS